MILLDPVKSLDAYINYDLYNGLWCEDVMCNSIMYGFEVGAVNTLLKGLSDEIF